MAFFLPTSIKKNAKIKDKVLVERKKTTSHA
jgi:hypothetical protein